MYANLGTTQKILGAGALGLVAGGGLGYLAARKRNRKSSKRRKAANRSNRRKGNNKRRSYRYPHTAGKRKDTSHRRIRFTKRGQPYIILRSGKARFIKMSSVKRSRKRSGGRY